MLYESENTIMMPMRLSIVSALPLVKIAGRITNTPASASHGATSRTSATVPAGHAPLRTDAFAALLAALLNAHAFP